MKALEKVRSILPRLWDEDRERNVPTRLPSREQMTPETLFDDLERMFDRMVDRFFEDSWGLPLRPGSFTTPWDISEDDEGFTLEVELPGYEPGELDVSVSRDRVSIRGEHEERESRSWWRRGSDGSVRGCRRVALELPVPIEIDHEGSDAQLRNGVLRIRLPKTEAARRRARRIPVAA